MKSLSFILVLLFWACKAIAQQSDTFSVYFPMDARQLTTTATQGIDSLFYADWLNISSQVNVVGYADYVGGAGTYNDELSKARAENVAAYLTENGIAARNINLIEGKGAIMRGDRNRYEGIATDRRVDIIRITKKIVPVPPAPPPQNLAEVKEGETLVLENILFYGNSHRVLPESMPALEQLLKELKKHPNISVRIEGHICCSYGQPDGLDEDTGEPTLSTNRARYIFDWLIKNGIARSRLEFKGYGGSRPLVRSEITQEDMKKNRRVEIRVISR